MKRLDELKAGVVGTGFIGVVHVDALRRLGVEVSSESNEELLLGQRDRPNEILRRDPGLLRPEAVARTHLPVAHTEGFADTFRELYRVVYADVARGGPVEEPDYPTFRDGHVEKVISDALAHSNSERRWVEAPL